MIIAATAVAGLALAGCTQSQLAATAGAGLGGVIAAALGGTPAQIGIGAALGGAAGWYVAEVRQSQTPGYCQAVNQYGQPIYVTPTGQYTTTPTQYPLWVQC